MSNSGVRLNVSVKEIELQRLDGTRVPVAFLIPDFQPTQAEPRIMGAVQLNEAPVAVASTSGAAVLASNSTPPSGPTCRAKQTNKCYNCPKTFNTKYMLKRHEKIHVGGEFPCLESGCGAAFRNQTTLTKHLVVAHSLQLRDPCRPLKKKKSNVKKSSTNGGRQSKGKKPGKNSKRMTIPLEILEEDNDTVENYDVREDAAAAAGIQFTPISSILSSGGTAGPNSSPSEIDMVELTPLTAMDVLGPSSELGLGFAALEETSGQFCPSSPTPAWLLGMMENPPPPEQQPSSTFKFEEGLDLNDNDIGFAELDMADWSLIFPDGSY